MKVPTWVVVSFAVSAIGTVAYFVWDQYARNKAARANIVPVDVVGQPPRTSDLVYGFGILNTTPTPPLASSPPPPPVTSLGERPSSGTRGGATVTDTPGGRTR